MARFRSLHLFFPGSLGSTIVTRFLATTDPLTPARIRLAAALLRAGLPGYGARCSGHSVSNHPCADRGSNAASRRDLPIGSPLWLGACRLLLRLRHDIAGSSCGTDRTSSLCPPSKENRRYGLVVPFPLLSTACRHTAVKVPYPSASLSLGSADFHHSQRAPSQAHYDAPLGASAVSGERAAGKARREKS